MQGAGGWKPEDQPDERPDHLRLGVQDPAGLRGPRLHELRVLVDRGAGRLRRHLSAHPKPRGQHCRYVVN